MAGRLNYLSPLVASLALVLPTSTQDAEEHRQRADRWLERHEVELGESPSFDQLLEKEHARIDLGIFEVYVMPKVLADPRWMSMIQDSLEGLLQLQATWLEWVEYEGKQAKRSKADQKVISKWIAGLGKKRINAPAELRGANLIEALKGKDKELEALNQFARFMRMGGSLGIAPPRPVVQEAGSTTEAAAAATSGSSAELNEFPPARLILAPSRLDIVEMTALLGVLEPDQQPYFWIEGTDIWTHLDHHGARIIAFEFGDGSGDYTASVSINRRNPRAVPQHVAQLGCYALLDSYFGEKMEPMIVGGLASNLLISIFDEADTRIDGDLRARSSAARSVFIAGGNPSGGLLPPSNANSRWRDGHGKGFFVRLLKASQSSGRAEAKQSWQKLAGFELRSDQGGNMIFHAPVLGPTVGTLPPDDFYGDYLEFIRAYRTAFLHWIVEEAGGSKKSSRKKFSAFMRAIGSKEKVSLPELFEEIYGAKLSSETGEGLFVKKDQPLEGKFLFWLSRQK